MKNCLSQQRRLAAYSPPQATTQEATSSRIDQNGVVYFKGLAAKKPAIVSDVVQYAGTQCT